MAVGNETNVILTGFGSKVPKWATDATLREMQRDVAQLVDKLVVSNRSQTLSTKASQTQLNGLADDLVRIRAGKKVDADIESKDSKDRLRSGRNITDAMEEFRVATRGGFTDLTGFVQATVAGRDAIVAGASNLKALGPLGATIGIAVAVFDAYIDVVRDAIKISNDLYDTGITFQNGMSDLAVGAGRAGMNIQEFSDTMVKNATLVNTLNGPAAYGALLGNIQSLTQKAGYYGLSLSKINDYSTDYLELMRRQGFLDRLSSQEQAQAAEHYISNLTLFSQALGKSREQINKEVMEANKRPDFAAFINTLNGEAKQVAQQAITSISGLFGDAAPEVTKHFQDLLVNPMAQADDFWSALHQLSPATYQYALQTRDMIASGKLTEKEANARMIKLAQGFKTLGGTTAEFKNMLTGMPNAVQQAAMSIQGISMAIQGMKEPSPEEIRQQERVQAAMTVLSNTYERISNQFKDIGIAFVLSHTETLTKVAEYAATFMTRIGAYMDQALEWVARYIDPKTKEAAVAQLTDSIANLFDTLFDKLFDKISDYVNAAFSPTHDAKYFQEKREKQAKGAVLGLDAHEMNMAGKFVEDKDLQKSAANPGWFDSKESPQRDAYIKMSLAQNKTLEETLAQLHSTDRSVIDDITKRYGEMKQKQQPNFESFNTGTVQDIDSLGLNAQFGSQSVPMISTPDFQNTIKDVDLLSSGDPSLDSANQSMTDMQKTISDFNMYQEQMLATMTSTNILLQTQNRTMDRMSKNPNTVK